MNKRIGGTALFPLMLATVSLVTAALVASACSSSINTIPKTSTTTQLSVVTQTSAPNLGTNITAPISTMTPPPSLSEVSYSGDVQPIFNNDCVMCHQGFAASGLNLETGSSWRNLVGQIGFEAAEPLVTIGSPDKSYLIAKLNNTQTQASGNGVQMPHHCTPLTSAQISLISQWIGQGAPNN